MTDTGLIVWNGMDLIGVGIMLIVLLLIFAAMAFIAIKEWVLKIVKKFKEGRG